MIILLVIGGFILGVVSTILVVMWVDNAPEVHPKDASAYFGGVCNAHYYGKFSYGNPCPKCGARKINKNEKDK